MLVRRRIYTERRAKLACLMLLVPLLIGAGECGHPHSPAVITKQNTKIVERAPGTIATNCTDIPPQKIYGITIEDTEHPEQILDTIKRLRKATTERIALRVVIDPDHDLNDATYQARLDSIKKEGVTVMALLADSHDLHKFRSGSDFKVTDVSKYRKRIQKALTTLGASIDVWEIGNEINGEWSGWKENEKNNARQDWEKASAEKRERSRQWTYNQVKAAYDVLQPMNKCMAVTFYYNDDQEHHTCWPGPDEISDGSKYEMLTWIKDYFSDKDMRDHIKYVFISYYENTECRKLLSGNVKTDATRFSNILSSLSQTFEKADIGFGEFGPECAYEEDCFYSNKDKRNRLCKQCISDITEFIPRYYREYQDELIRQQTPRFIGGYFYWFGLQDMIPSNSVAANELMRTLSRK
jgi:hypothetical protein